MYGKIKYVLGKPRLKTIRILFDSGASKSILFTKKDTKKFRLRKDSTTKWATIAGEITTTYRTKATFCLPELDPSKIITKQMVVCTKPSTLCHHLQRLHDNRPQDKYRCQERLCKYHL